MRTLIASALLLIATTSADAAMVVKPISYTVDKTVFAGHLVYDDSSKALRPGLVMVPNWMGETDAAVDKAKTIASTNFVILVADMYGEGVRPKNGEEARAQVSKLYADREVLRARINEAVATLRGQVGKAPLQPGKIAAIGFCFGGTTVLELARSGSDIAGVVSFHGGLSTSKPAAAGSVKAPILVLNGADDRGTSLEDIGKFEEEMNAAGADWQFVNFSGAVHCFAEPDANSPPGCLYNERAAKRAFRMMDNFLAEVFAAH
ncbi:MAG TPA: dienelactone hydrolase family protein [Dokdonella sp.]|uniref:dienelactone hydrolase family protein n=1 Tax=Dokdonella sp. TaxID=2291710 RepID=UPI002D801526|nr:dienelactone hydrolase family protein [Dokdonella sp.]HET9032736.1 dienelactone hydrolase family protein [Dokdonella sp.]